MADDQRPVWIPDESDLFTKAIVIGEEDGKLRVKVDRSGQVKLVDTKDVENVNPSQFDFARDMAELTYLNEPSVVNNLRMRWSVGKIYTYSGLFLVAVNPYKDLPIYGLEEMATYRNVKKDECPPHIYAVSEQAYRSLMETGQDQSVLVTGESGAGKTENTKKVIQYLSHITNSDTCRMDERIWQTNPILEAFGNAQTIRNANSSRFGKFVKIQFNTKTKDIIGASIQWYLLEKSRVIHLHEQERNYHIFYQLLAGAPEKLKEKLFLTDIKGPKDFNYLRKGIENIEGVDDSDLYGKLITAFKIMGFSDIQVQDIMTVVAAILWFGQSEYRASSADQGDFVDSKYIERAATLLQLNVEDLKDSILRPKVKAGKEIIRQSRTAAQAQDTTNALAKALFERLFGFIVSEINKLLTSNVPDAPCIGVLDIAGFEIFEQNSFEQLCINYTNEKLQQFFNHHMFVLEQEEYVRENVDWEYRDYGSDLQPTIELIETNRNPMGILSILDEESVLPSGNDSSFNEKLAKQWSSKNEKFTYNRLGDGFTIAHYAQAVEYKTTGWLEKNKDPLSDSVVQVMKTSESSLVRQLFLDSQDESLSTKKPKSSIMRTVGQRHKQQLNDLMSHLDKTQPHFVRCILPNQQRSPKIFDNSLVLDQLRYNGVLEGIRIARSGFPNRLDFKEFRSRYGPLVGEIQSRNLSGHQAAAVILEKLGLDSSQYKVGLSKVFFRNGVLAKLERQLEEMIEHNMIIIQSFSRGLLMRRDFNRRIFQKQAAVAIASCFRSSNVLSQDPWWQFSQGLKTVLASKDQLNEKRKDLHLNKLESNLQQMKDENYKLLSSKNQLRAELIDALQANEELISNLKKFKEEEKHRLIDHENALQMAHQRDEASSTALKELSSKHSEMREAKVALQKQVAELKGQLEKANMESELARQLQEKESQALKDLKSVSKEVDELYSTKKLQEEQITGLQKEIESSLAKITTLNETIATISKQSELLSSKCSQLSSELELMTSKNVALEDKYSGCKLELAQLKEAVSNHTNLQQELEEWHIKYKDCARALETQKTDLHQARSELQTNSDEMARLRKENVSVRSLAGQIKEAKVFQREIADLKIQLEKKTTQINTLQESLLEESTAKRVSSNSLGQENAKLKNNLKNTTEQNNKMKEELNNSKMDYNNLKNDFMTTKNDLRNSEMTIKKLQSELAKSNLKSQQNQKAEAVVATEVAVREAVANVTKERNDKELELRNALRKISLLESSLRNASANFDNIAIASLKQEVSQKAAIISEWEKKFDNLPQDVRDFKKLKEDYERQRREKNKLFEDHSLMLLKIKRTADDLDLLRIENKRLETQLNTHKNNMINVEKNRRSVNTSGSSESNPKYNARLGELADLEFKRALQERELKSRGSDVIYIERGTHGSTRHEDTGDNLAHSHDSDKNRTLRNISNDRRVSDRRHMAAEHIRAKDLEEEVEVYKSRSNEYYSKLEKAEMAIQTAQRSEELANRKASDIRSELERSKNAYEVEISQLRGNILELQKEQVKKSAKLEKLKMVNEVNRDLELRVEHLNTTVKDLCNERDKLVNDKIKIEKRLLEISRPNNRSRELEETIDSLRNRENLLKIELKQSQLQLDQQEKYAQKLSESVANHEIQVDHYNNEIEVLKTENSTMLLKLRRSNHDIDEVKAKLLRAEKELVEYRRSKPREAPMAFV